MAKQPGERTPGRVGTPGRSFSLSLASQLGCLQRERSTYFTRGSQVHLPPIHLDCSPLRQAGLAHCRPISELLFSSYTTILDPPALHTPFRALGRDCKSRFSSGTLKGRVPCALGKGACGIHSERQGVGPGFLASCLYLIRFFLHYFAHSLRVHLCLKVRGQFEGLRFSSPTMLIPEIKLKLSRSRVSASTH